MMINIISQKGIVYSGTIRSVTVPGVEGELTILPHHIPLITILKQGKIRIYDEKGQERVFEITKGILEVRPEEVTVLI